MPSFEQPVIDNRIIITVTLSRGQGEPRIPFRALMDTGAQGTAISPKVVNDLKLTPTGTILRDNIANRSFGRDGQRVSVSR